MSEQAATQSETPNTHAFVMSHLSLGRVRQMVTSRLPRMTVTRLTPRRGTWFAAQAATRLGKRDRIKKRRSAWTPWFPEPQIRQVCPGRVVFFNQADLPHTNPPLYLLLAGDGVTNVCELLEVHEPRHTISSRGAGAVILSRPGPTALRFPTARAKHVGSASPSRSFAPARAGR